MADSESAEREAGRLQAALAAAQVALAEERRVFSAGPVVVFRWRNAPGWPVEYVTPNVEQMFGYSADEFLTGAVRYGDLIHPEDIERVAHEVAAASEGAVDRFVHEPYRLRRRNGEMAWLDDHTIVHRDAEGRAESYLGYVIDVTERKRQEEESARLRAQVLDGQKFESLALLAGNIAHDFNNLLTGVLGNVALAQAQSPPEIAQQLVEARTCTLRAAELCRQLLAYSGRGRFVVAPRDLNTVVTEAADLLRAALPTNVALQLLLGTDLPGVRADAAQLRQLFVNLITNSIDAIGAAKGTITVATRAEGNRLAAVVTDDGCGMDESTRRRAFEPFFTTKQSGRGLGMAAALGILRGHGGTIRLDSQPGIGTRIEVLLPTTTDEVQPEHPLITDDTSAWAASAVALVVDDEPAVRSVARSVLAQAGFRVITADDGAAAVQELRAHGDHVVIVLLDLTMPGMSGIETLTALRTVRPDVPVVLASGYNRQDVLGRDGIDARVPFLQKPFLPRDLIAAIRRAIQDNPFRAPC